MENLQQTQITLTSNTITIIFKDGTTATFEHALQWNKNNEYYQIIFYVDNKLLYTDYEIDDIATVVLGYVDIVM